MFLLLAAGLDAKGGIAEKDDTAMPAKSGLDAMMRGDGNIVTGPTKR